MLYVLDKIIKEKVEDEYGTDEGDESMTSNSILLRALASFVNRHALSPQR